jgi:hypothetical protein
MTVSPQPDSHDASDVIVRDYANGDYDACRSLWAELTEFGRMLIGRVVGEARARGYEYLAIRPMARNVAAVRRFHAAGFRALGGHVDLTMDLAERRHEWLPGASLHGLDFDY